MSGPAPTRCGKCGTWAAAIVCPICKEPRPATIVLHPAMSHAQALKVCREIGSTIGQARAAFAHRDPEAA